MVGKPTKQQLLSLALPSAQPITWKNCGFTEAKSTHNQRTRKDPFAQSYGCNSAFTTSQREYVLPLALDKLNKQDCLILDIFRRIRQKTSILFAIISERYENKSVTRYLRNGIKFSWIKAMAIAAVDRLVHHETILELNVESYRKRRA